MARKHKYYKVTTSDNKSVSNVYTLQYSTDKFTHAVNGSGCLVFNSQAAARKFKLKGQRIWEVAVTAPVDTPPFRLSSGFLATGSEVTDVWAGRINTGIDYWPDGTEAFSSIKLIRRVR